MKLIPAILLIVISGCETVIDDAIGGYKYPKSVTDKEATFYYYPLRDFLSKRDSFRHSYDYLYYRLFNEPNLSIKPMNNETFRLTYSTAFGESFIITLTDSLVITKEGDATLAYVYDTSRLSPVEKIHLNLLNRRYPIDTTGKNPWQKRYLDSMVKLYPQLLNPDYYHTLYEKSFMTKNDSFSYKVSKVHLSANQYNSLVQEINSSGYWKLPYQMNCNSDMTDGYGFSLEANTKNKYKIVQVEGCPDDTSKLTKVCQRIINYAKFDNKPHLIWKGTVDSVEVSH